MCKTCAVEKPLSGFYANAGMRDGHLSWCKPCTYARYRNGRSERQRKLLLRIHKIKVERGCVDCGYNTHAAALDFDHLPGHIKTARIATMSGGSKWELIEAEIAKCEVVCANCHRIRTTDRRSSLTFQETLNG